MMVYMPCGIISGTMDMIGIVLLFGMKYVFILSYIKIHVCVGTMYVEKGGYCSG